MVIGRGVINRDKAGVVASGFVLPVNHGPGPPPKREHHEHPARAGGRVITTAAVIPPASEPADADSVNAGPPAGNTAGVDEGKQEPAHRGLAGELLAACADAETFKNTFEPSDGVDYKWVVALAKEEYTRSVDTFKRVDDKGATVMNYLGAGTGVLTLGSLAGVAAGQISPWVIIAAIPSVILAGTALFLAARSRRTTLRPVLPRIPRMVEYADHFGEKAEAAFLGQWHLTTALMHEAIMRKGSFVDRSLSLFFWAVVALSLPLAVSLGQKLTAKPATPPATHIIIENRFPEPQAPPRF